MSDFLLTKLILDVDGIKRTAKDAGRPREKNRRRLVEEKHGGAKTSVFKPQSVVVWICCPLA